MSQVVIKIEDLSPVKKKMSLEIPWSEVKNELDTVYHDVGKKAKVKGFRPGKVPRKVLETYYKDQVEEETVTNIVNKYYWQSLEERGIAPVSRPEINQEGIKENTDFSFSASFETEPEFEPKGYMGMELEKEAIKITDDDVKKRIDEIRQMFATMEEVVDDRPAGKGDFVVIDFAGSLDGEFHKELKADDYFLEIGSEKFVPGFEEQLIGVKKGETREVKVTFPEDYHENKFAGKEVIFNVTVKSIREKKLPKDDENFIKNFEKYNTFEDFEKDVRKSLEEKAGRTTEVNLQNSITEKLIKENDFEVPLALVDKQIYYMMFDTQQRMMSAGIDEHSAMDFSFKMRDKYKGDAEKIVKSFLLLKKIAQKESFVAEADDIDKYLQELAGQSGRDYESLKKMYESEEKKDYLQMEVIQKKVFDFIQKNANIKIVEKTGVNLEAR
ncbi:MAG: trigger factor [Deltaproteobacteria bacterium]|nr:trigger factor [Deltaproteobacteria bacterium]